MNFILSVTALLLTINECLTSEQKTASRFITIRKTIHKNETLTYNVTQLFPGLVEDPRIEQLIPETGTWEQVRPENSNFSLTRSITPIYSSWFDDIGLCEDWVTLDNERYVGTCEDRKVIFLMRQDVENRRSGRYKIFTAPQNETIVATTADVSAHFLYIACLRSLDFKIQFYAIPLGGPLKPYILSAAFESRFQFQDGVMTIKVGRNSTKEHKRIYVFLQASPVIHQRQIITHPTEFVTFLHDRVAITLEYEGFFTNREIFPNPPIERMHRVYLDYPKVWRMQFLSVMPHSYGTWIFSAVTMEDGNNHYVVQSCRLMMRNVTKITCDVCTMVPCVVFPGDCDPEEKDFRFPAMCQFGIQNQTTIDRSNLLLSYTTLSPAQCAGYYKPNCRTVQVNCSVPLDNCKSCQEVEVEEPYFVCDDIKPVATLCLNLDIGENSVEQFYRIGSFSEDGESSLYLLTNCQFVKTTFVGASLNRTEDSGSFRFTQLFRESLAMDKTGSNIFTFLRPFDDNTAYLAVYSEITHTMRIFQNQSIHDDDMILLMDPLDLNRDFIVGYNFNHEYNRTTFTISTYRDQSFYLQLRSEFDPKLLSPTVVGRLVAECKNVGLVVYQFELTVLNTLDVVRGQEGLSANYWFYSTAEDRNDWQFSELPIDMSSLAANDPYFNFTSDTPGLNLAHLNYFHFENQEVFQYKGKYQKMLVNRTLIRSKLRKENYYLHFTFSNEISVLECGSIKPNSTTLSETDGFGCKYVMSGIGLDISAKILVLDYQVVHQNTTDTYFLFVLYLGGLFDMRMAQFSSAGKESHVRFVFEEASQVAERGIILNVVGESVSVLAIVGTTQFLVNQTYIVSRSFYQATIPVQIDSKQRNLTVLLKHVSDIFHNGAPVVMYRSSFENMNLVQNISPTEIVVTWFKLKNIKNANMLQVEVEATELIDARRYRPVIFGLDTIILLDKILKKVFYQVRLNDRIKQLDTNVRPIYEGVLPVPGLDTNGDSIKDLVDIDVIQGIFIMGLNRSETDTANITKQFIDIYVVDMRGNDDDPIGRLRLKMTVEVPPYNGPLLVLQYLDPVTLRIHALICFEQGNIHVVGELHGSKATLKILPSKLGNGITERNMRYSGSACNESDSLLVPLKIVAAEWDDVIVAHATSNPYDLENNETSILEIESHLINIASHRAGYDVIAPESFKGTFEVIPMIVPDKRVSSLILPQPFQFKAEDKIFVHDDAHLLIRGKNSVTIFKIDSGRPPILLFNKTYSQNVLTAYMTYDPKMNYKVRGSGPLEFVFVLLKGDYDKNDVDMNVYDSTNFTSTAYYTDKDVGYCDCIRFEVIKRNQEIFSFSVHCRTKRGSGTTWTLSMVDLIPTNTDDKSITGTILGGFKPGDPYNGKPFQMKYKPLDGSGYGMMRPTSSSTLSYYFFDNMGQVGLMYFGNNKEVFGYHTFSTTCVLRQDTSISCRIFEQDMDLGCIVLCDQVRIESFKVRIRVDELDTENNEALTGVKVIKEEGYKIPINHKVLHLQKGETFDFVVTETSDKNQSVLMYDTATGLILYRMNASEICPKENPGCKLDSLYIHQFGDNRILLLPEGGQLDNSMFIWQKPQLNFSRDQLRKSGSLKEFKLVINSVTTKETNKMISILDLFKPKQEDFFWVYLAFVIVLAIFLVLCFLLLLYMNWRAEERAQVRKEDKEREKNSGLDRVNRMSKQDYKEVPSEKENNRTSLLPQPSVAADTNRTSLYKKKTIKL